MSVGEIFIGRAAECARLRKDVFRVPEGSFGGCYSLIGPNGVGKTTLVRHLSQELERDPVPNTYYFSTVMEDGMTFWSYWMDLLLRFAEEIPEAALRAAPHFHQYTVEKILETYRFFRENIANVEAVTFKMYAVGYLNSIFTHYTKLGIRIILTIDEFDRARQIFADDGQFFQRLFGLTSKGASRHDLSILTISRRSVSTIAHHMQEGSNFEDAYPPLALKGFSNEELDQYFATYRDLPTGELPEIDRQQILFLCGRSPGLLMRMRHEIDLLDSASVDISALYTEHGGFIRTAYERMCTLMKTEYVDQAKTQDSLDIFCQQFIGPICVEEFSGKIERLYSYGFITRSGDTEDIFTLAGVKERTEAGSIYEPLAPYIVDYVKNVILPDDTRSLAGLLEKAERSMRQMLATVLQKSFPDRWEEVLEEDVPKKEDYLSNLRCTALQNDTGVRSLTVSKLNVMSFNDYYKVVRNHWPLMSSYFHLYNGQSDIRETMQYLNDCRNSSAHLNLEILNNESRRRLREECERLLESLEGPSKPAVPTPVIPPKAPDERETMVGQRVRLQNLEATSRGGLRGTIAGGTYMAALSPAHLTEMNVYAKQYAGKSLWVRIIRWDENAQKFNAELA